MDNLSEEYFIPDYEEEEVVDPRIPCTTRNPKHGRICFICGGRFTHARRHVVRTHLPWFCCPESACWRCEIQFGQVKFLQIHEDQYHHGDEENGGFSCDRWADRMRELLLEVAKRNTGADSFSRLVEWTQEQNILKECSSSLFQESDFRLLHAFQNVCHLSSSETSDRSQLKVDSNVTSLLHWRVLSSIIHLTPGSEELVDFKAEAAGKELCKELIDSHFHLDMWCRRSHQLRLEREETTGVVHLVKLVANYCFPRNWPSSSGRQEVRLDERIKFTFGIHPRLAGLEGVRTLRRWCDQLEEIITARGTVAIGECGLDTSVKISEGTRRRQRTILKAQAKLAAERDLPIVIHCRGDRETSEECLAILSQHLRSTHHIHRHCFTGDISDYQTWSRAFTNCKFGISPLYLKDHTLREVVNQLPLEDLLLESDAPYISLERGSIGSPFCVKEIAERIARERAVEPGEVAEITTRNARKLYNI